MIYFKQTTDMAVHPYLLAGLAYLGYKSAYDWKVTSGRRDSAEQARLYAEGRTTAGPTRTDAPAGSSAHEFGLAVDLYPTVDKGRTVILDTNHPAFAERDAILQGNAFLNSNLQTDVVISSGPDRPHLQVRDWQKHKDWQNTAIACAAVTALVSLFLVTR